MLPMPLKSRIFSFKNKIIYWRFFVLLAGRRMVRTSSGHHRYKTVNLYKITERIPKKMRRFFRGGCKCPNAKMESQNYLLSFCAGVQEGLLQAYHEQCRSTVIVKTRPNQQFSIEIAVYFRIWKEPAGYVSCLFVYYYQTRLAKGAACIYQPLRSLIRQPFASGHNI